MRPQLQPQPSPFKIPLARPCLAGKEKDYVWTCLQEEELSWHGRYVSQFERAFADFCGTKFGVATCNGTAALHLALLAVGVGPGWKVFLPALTYVATANAVMYCGAEPVFCDVEKRTWNIDPDDVVKRLEQNYHQAAGVCLLPVHLYGVPADMGKLLTLTQHYQMVIVEDAAEAHGASWRGQMVGSIGKASAFSFYANKILTTGEGGMVLTSDSDVADRARLLRGQGQRGGAYRHVELGYNYRMTNIQAAIGFAQVECAGYHLLTRQRVARWYRARLDKRYVMQDVYPESRSAEWMTTVLVPRNRDAVVAQLANRGVETRPVFIPLPALPMYQRHAVPETAAAIAGIGINLPTFGDMTEEEVDIVVKELDDAVDNLC